ncbi:MAG: ferredoxin family protein [Candidatus Marinimicrobia bacterium]|jgi:ferredoxin|nr:ferredoxin family protein [Candidatus Neomarinimicrobiota bacterium]MDP6789118.1 ferredoxin family protein [Candidatus Neomarinimicrobiota bacterium]MDP7072020.1 ferredoxin family protein [Candidatus Neomarinimicrobiota bacterium]|tara:strand:+ start:609 stop:914 length:306 start_codon:yes stop_codon:yes gene_type:complete
MTYIIAEPCVGVCDTACVEVCPVDCIHHTQDDAGEVVKQKLEAGEDIEGLTLYINPEECIDCGACEPECPVEAIFEESEVPEEWHNFIAMNYEHFGQTPPS